MFHQVSKSRFMVYHDVLYCLTWFLYMFYIVFYYVFRWCFMMAKQDGLIFPPQFFRHRLRLHPVPSPQRRSLQSSPALSAGRAEPVAKALRLLCAE